MSRAHSKIRSRCLTLACDPTSKTLSTVAPHRVLKAWLIVMMSAWSGAALAAPPPPPGGPHALYHGGDNQAGYPSITSVGVDDSLAAAPLRLLVSATPNPSRGEVRFLAQAPRRGVVRVRLVSVDGRRVREWRSMAASGWIEWRWDGRDQRGLPVANGMYFYAFEVGEERAIGRLVLIR